MVNDKYDSRWSPFDPVWYKDAFDKPINVADMNTNREKITNQGFVLPDIDGSKSSIYRNEAKLNNSFNEELLRESLKDIYLNNSHKLIASNHDNTHFFQWHGTMSDMKLVANTNYCQFSIPCDDFIYPSERDSFKLSQYYRKWIKVEDILNHWDIFKWHCLLFIDQRVYSEYELRIDDHEVTIKFRYYDFWIRQNYPVYIYRFDTNASTRVFISRELCQNQLSWKIPVSYLTDQRVANSDAVVVAINKISDKSIRKDGETNVEVIGDNLEFIHITDGMIDLSNISDFNRSYILSEKREWLWMSIFVPKFFHEYPIVLPTDVVYQPYEANLQPVATVNYDMIQHAKSKVKYTDEEYSQVYVDLNGELKQHHDTWKQLIRPIVLSDAFDGNYVEPSDRLLDDVNKLRDLTVNGADLIEQFRFYVKNYSTDEEFKYYCDELRKSIDDIRNCMHDFLDKLYAEYDTEYELLYKRFITIMDEIDDVGIDHELFHTVTMYERPDRDFWMVISPLIWIPRGLADKYYVINVIHDMGDNTNVWDSRDKYMNQVRFQRPVDESDFWTFEYDNDKQVWRPYPLSIERHFPDVYVLKDSSEDVPTLNRVFKAFFFYSDTMNVIEQSSDIIRPSESWDDDINEYHIDQRAIYRDIFMEKFYWMGMRSIYKGVLVTNNKWEVVEYVIDNKSYDRFNQLFLQSMDPYFKLGLATYLRSPDYGFPFDDAINKMKESIDTEFIGYKRITNFEVYLNKTWIPSYFDFVTRIMDDWQYEDRLIRRPKSTFDIYRLLPTILSAQNEIYDATRKLVNLIHWIVEGLSEEDYKMNVGDIEQLRSLIDSMYEYISGAYNDTKNLDVHIYSIDDINSIADKLTKYIDHQELITDKFNDINADVTDHNVHGIKRNILDEVMTHVDTIEGHIDSISSIVNDFDFDKFMGVLNDINTYFDHNKDNPNDESLLGHINQFNDAWTTWVKTKRTNLFISSNQLFGFYDIDKLYEDEDIDTLMNMVESVKNGLLDLNTTIDEFYDGFGYPIDEKLYNKFEESEYLLETLNIKLGNFLEARSRLVDEYNSSVNLFDSMGTYPNDTEFGYMNEIKKSFHDVIRHLSYIAGQGHKDDAKDSLRELNRTMQMWYRYLDTEKEVFDNLIILADPPIEIINILNKYRNMIISIIEYMDTVNIKYIPDSEWPTYSDVYRVTKVEIVTSGFNNSAGDYAFAPQLGTYVIDSINEDNATKSIVDSMYRNTTFRNPMIQYRPYDTITNGNGMGLSIKPIEVDHQVIVNDGVIDNYITKMQSSLKMLKKSASTYNSRNNKNLQYTLNDISEMKLSWDNMIEKFADYMTSDVKDFMNRLMTSMIRFIDPCNEFINSRDDIKLDEFIRMYQDYIYDSFNYTREKNMQDETFFYYDAIIRQSYDEVIAFYGTGTSWTDGQQLRPILMEAIRVIKFYWKKVFENSKRDEVIDHIKDLHDRMIGVVRTSITSIDSIPTQIIDINGLISRSSDELNKVPELKVDTWYRLNNPSVAIQGMEYKIGDIVKLITDDTDDVILLQISDIDDFGRVKSVKWFMDYALPYKLNGVMHTETRVGIGYGLQVSCSSSEVQLQDSTLLDDENSSISTHPKFDENDLMMFKFENIHDLPVGYEVFIGGKQISDFVVRHENADDPLHPSNIDIVYINANSVINLQNSSIYIPAEHYFIYKIDDISVRDPGAGYCLDQNIFVDADSHLLRMKASELAPGPLKGISFATLTDSGLLYEKHDPGKNGAEVVTDSMNNIDDEFNVGYYDNLTKTGYSHPLTKSLDPDEYSYTVKRFDDMSSDNRNDHFMYPNVTIKEDYPDNGDPDFNWYQGSRIDNSCLSKDYANMVPMTIREMTELCLFDTDPSDCDNDAYDASGVRQINDKETNILWDDGYVSEDNPGNQRIGLTKMSEEELNTIWNGGSIVDDDDSTDQTHKTEDDLLWNGIWNVIPPTDSFIPDDDRIPVGQPVKGEYQLIQTLRIHNTNGSTDIVELTPMTIEELTELCLFDTDPSDCDNDAYDASGVRQINDKETNILWDDGYVSEDNPGNQRIKLKTISPLEIFMMWNGQVVDEDDGLPDIEDGEIIDDVTAVFDFRVDSLKDACMISGDLIVESFADLPRHKEDYPDGSVGKRIIVEHDETHYGHRMMYRIRTFVAAGFFVYDLPEVADYSWNEFNVNWMDSDWIADFPTMIAQYPEAPWDTSPTYRKIMHTIMDKKLQNTFVPSLTNNSSFIANLTVDDISVYNWSTHEWEDLHDESRWQLVTYSSDERQEWGFTLRFLQDGTYSYDMRLYLNKTPYTQQKNAAMKRNALLDISTVIHSEVNRAAINIQVNTGRNLIIRKLFPYEQKESYRIGFDSDGASLGYKMDFKIAPYIHFRNQIHLEDIKVYNVSAGRFENILDTKLFEVQFKDPKAVSVGYETNTRISQVLIGNAGNGFSNGVAWAWNSVYNIIVFGNVKADYLGDGHLIEFIPSHCPNPPKENISLEFEVFQNDDQSDVQKGLVVIEFVTEHSEVFGDGYIHNVINPMAPVPEEFRVIVLYDLDGVGEYEIIIDNSPKVFTFVEPHWLTLPTFHIEDTQVPSDKLYVLTDKGRMPLINPSTKKPTLNVTQVANGTDVMFMNLYRKFSRMNIYSVPYPMRSVYVQRKIPEDGYIDLKGKINKPLNKKYFEFWVNGKLMQDEVTIISPTKIFLHGLKSLKNLEIIEINRDPNEFFSDSFLEVRDNESRPYYKWNYNTYLDDALSGELDGDNYSTEEQEYLLSPVWPQISDDHPEYKNYPPNVDIENDILLMVSPDDDFCSDTMENPLYPYIVLDPPTLEGRPIFDKGLSFEHFGLVPISDEMIVDMLNDEWKEELKSNPYLQEHFIISDDEWYGTTAQLYDEFGIRVHTLNEAVYNVHTDKILRINTKTKSNKIVTRPVEYDLI